MVASFRYTMGMKKFVFGLWWLLGGLLAMTALAPASAELHSAPFPEPIPYPVWHSEPVAPSNYAHALALDSVDRPHLLFHDPATRMLRHAVRLDDGWVYDDVAWMNSVHPDGTFDLAIAPQDVPCMVYATSPPVLDDPVDTTLTFGCRNDGPWQLTPIDDGGRDPTLVLDGSGRPHIALVQGLEAVYFTLDGDQWRREVVGADTAYMGRAWLYLDALERPHVIFSGSEGLFEGVREALGWEVVRFPVPGLLALALDAAGRPWLLVTDAEPQWGHPPFSLNQLLLGVPDGSGGWATEMLHEEYDWQIAADLVMVGTDTAHIAYRDASGGLRYQWRTAAESWRVETPVTGADGDVHLALGSDGQPRVAYGRGGELWLASRRITLLDEWLYLPAVSGP